MRLVNERSVPRLGEGEEQNQEQEDDYEQEGTIGA